MCGQGGDSLGGKTSHCTASHDRLQQAACSNFNTVEGKSRVSAAGLRPPLHGPVCATHLLLSLLLACRYDEEVCTLHNAAAAGTAAERFLTGSAAAAAAAAVSAAVTSLSFRTGGSVTDPRWATHPACGALLRHMTALLHSCADMLCFCSGPLCVSLCVSALCDAAVGNGLPLLAAGGSAGVVALWNLEQRCLHHVVRDAHDSALTGLHFFAGEPRLMSAGADNSIKQWVSRRRRACCA